MLPKSGKAALTTEFRPIASIRLLYKTFAYMVLGRIEHKLEAAQPEEQHGFRSKRRVEEHLLTATLIFEKTRAANLPVWIISLDLSKAFDRVSWPALWEALLQQGISKHLVWILQTMYYEQTGQISGTWGKSREFHIRAGVRQGCVLSPRLFCAVLQVALQAWRRKVGTSGIDLDDRLQKLLDLRFADDVLVFATTQLEAGSLLDALVTELAQVGLILNASKTVVLTSEAQPPLEIKTPSGITVKVIGAESAHKWLGCMLTASGRHGLDVEYHLQAASKAFYANRNILVDRKASVTSRLRYFEAVVTPVACFAAGHRTLYKDDLQNMDVNFRKLARKVVGFPNGVDWSRPWHEILHLWHSKLSDSMTANSVQCWSQRALKQYWNMAGYAACLPDHRWLRRVLAWSPSGHRSQGRPRHTWESTLRFRWLVENESKL